MSLTPPRPPLRARLGRALRPGAAILGVGGVAAMSLTAPGLTAGLEEFGPARMATALYAGAQPGPETPASARTAPAALREVVRRFVRTHPGVPGASLSATSPALGVRAGVAAGRVSLTSRRPLDARSTFRTASVTKPFTAAAVLRLAEDGRLALDAPIDRYLPAAITRGLALSAPVTVRQLLQHTSGIYDYGTDPRWLLDVTTHPRRRWTPAQLLEVARTHGRPYGPAGRAFHYSDTGYVLLGYILERVTGRPLAAAYRELLALRRLPATYLEGREAAPERLAARAHQYLGPLDATGFDPSFDNFGGGGLVSDAPDLDRFGRALLTGGVFRHRSTHAELCDTVAAGDEARYGLGVGLRLIAGYDVWFHFGFFGAFLAYVPALDLSLGGTINQNRADPADLVHAVVVALARLPRRTMGPRQSADASPPRCRAGRSTPPPTAASSPS